MHTGTNAALFCGLQDRQSQISSLHNPNPKAWFLRNPFSCGYHSVRHLSLCLGLQMLDDILRQYPWRMCSSPDLNCTYSWLDRTSRWPSAVQQGCCAVGDAATASNEPWLKIVHPCILLKNHLDRGYNSGSKLDTLAKNLCEYLRAKTVPMPKKFLANGKL